MFSTNIFRIVKGTLPFVIKGDSGFHRIESHNPNPITPVKNKDVGPTRCHFC